MIKVVILVALDLAELFLILDLQRRTLQVLQSELVLLCLYLAGTLQHLLLPVAISVLLTLELAQLMGTGRTHS